MNSTVNMHLSSGTRVYSVIIWSCCCFKAFGHFRRSPADSVQRGTYGFRQCFNRKLAHTRTPPDNSVRLTYYKQTAHRRCGHAVIKRKAFTGKPANLILWKIICLHRASFCPRDPEVRADDVSSWSRTRKSEFVN